MGHSHNGTRISKLQLVPSPRWLLNHSQIHGNTCHTVCSLKCMQLYKGMQAPKYILGYSGRELQVPGTQSRIRDMGYRLAKSLALWIPCFFSVGGPDGALLKHRASSRGSSCLDLREIPEKDPKFIFRYPPFPMCREATQKNCT